MKKMLLKVTILVTLVVISYGTYTKSVKAKPYCWTCPLILTRSCPQPDTSSCDLIEDGAQRQQCIQNIIYQAQAECNNQNVQDYFACENDCAY